MSTVFSDKGKIFPANKKPVFFETGLYINLLLQLKRHQLTRISTMIWFLP